MNSGALHSLPRRQLISPLPYSPPKTNAAFFRPGITITHEALFQRSCGTPLSGTAVNFGQHRRGVFDAARLGGATRPPRAAQRRRQPTTTMITKRRMEVLLKRFTTKDTHDTRIYLKNPLRVLSVLWPAFLDGDLTSQTSPSPARDRSCRRPSAPGTRSRCAASGARRQHVVEPPADVARAHLAPRRPPREQIVVVGIERRGRRSTRPRPMIRSISARSSGSWPIARGLRSFGCTSRSVRATFRSPQRTIVRPCCCCAAAIRVELLRGTASWRESPCRRSARRSRRRSARRARR